MEAPMAKLPEEERRRVGG